LRLRQSGTVWRVPAVKVCQIVTAPGAAQARAVHDLIALGEIQPAWNTIVCCRARAANSWFPRPDHVAESGAECERAASLMQNSREGALLLARKGLRPHRLNRRLPVYRIFKRLARDYFVRRMVLAGNDPGNKLPVNLMLKSIARRFGPYMQDICKKLAN
jgi:hypothetical protein